MNCKTCGYDLQGNEYHCPTCGANVDYVQAVADALAGKEEGFAFLYEATYRNKLFIAMKYMKNEDRAMDILHDAYVKAFSGLSGLTDPRAFPGWLSTIVANTAKNALRNAHDINFSDLGTEEGDGDAFAAAIEDEDMTTQPELACTAKETQEMVRELIDSLSDEQRMCILMFHIEGYSIRDIAAILDCSENTVKSRLNYGRKNIKAKAEELQKRGYKLYSYTPAALLTYLLMAERGTMLAAGTFEAAAGAGSAFGTALLHGGAAGAVTAAGAAGSSAAAGAASGKTTASGVAKHAFLKTTAGKLTAAAASVAVAGGAAGATYAVTHQTTWKTAYYEVLEDYEDEIYGYTWQYNNEFVLLKPDGNEYMGRASTSGGCVVIQDLTGDDVPELIFFAKDEEHQASLYIYTYEDKKAELAYQSAWDTYQTRDISGAEEKYDSSEEFVYLTGGGTPYLLFICDGTFYAYRNPDWVNDSNGELIRFESTSDGTIEEAQTWDLDESEENEIGLKAGHANLKETADTFYAWGDLYIEIDRDISIFLENIAWVNDSTVSASQNEDDTVMSLDEAMDYLEE